MKGKNIHHNNAIFYMRTRLIIICSFLFLNHFTNPLLCQDSLYLVGTIIGESNAKRITGVKGIGDVNGDGYGDFMVTTADNTVRLYLGSKNFNLTPSVVFHYPGKYSSYTFGGCAGIGDVNGDGYNDFVIKAVFSDEDYSPKGQVFVYYGGPNIDTIPKYEFHDPWIQDYLVLMSKELETLIRMDIMILLLVIHITGQMG